MTEEHYKQVYDILYRKYEKLLNFIEALESSTNNFDDLCDCPVGDGCSEDGIHAEGCRVRNVRHDYDALFKKDSSKPSKV